MVGVLGENGKVPTAQSSVFPIRVHPAIVSQGLNPRRLWESIKAVGSTAHNTDARPPDAGCSQFLLCTRRIGPFFTGVVAGASSARIRSQGQRTCRQPSGAPGRCPRSHRSGQYAVQLAPGGFDRGEWVGARSGDSRGLVGRVGLAPAVADVRGDSQSTGRSEPRGLGLEGR